MAAVALLAACEGTQTGDAETSTGSGVVPERVTSTPVVQDAPEGLEQYYSQVLTWSECEGGNQCAALTVPVDYAEPDGATIELSLLRVPAREQAHGSLVVNPGGPGGSGVDYAIASGGIIPEEVRNVYDVVGFDPRGVGRSAPISCLPADEVDAMLGGDPTPDDPAEEAEQAEQLEAFANACEQNAGELLGHVSTPEAARDMDVLRAALGDQELAYLGASYGTFLGATYAALFPERVGRLVLDGAVDPTITGLEMGLGQAEGFERATRAYAEDCVAAGDCPLGDDADAAMERIPELLTELDAEPIAVQGDKVAELTEGWAMYGIVAAMYSEQYWPILTQALEAAEGGDGSTLMYLANAYASRNAQGEYKGNMMQAIHAVNCLDRPADAEQSDLDSDKVLRQFEEVSPTWGRYLVGDGPCDYWPVQAQETIEDYSAPGAAPILVVGTTRDPATPYDWAVRLAEILESGVLVTRDGDGHTGYGQGNECVDDAVNSYLIDGTVPEDGLRC